MMLVHSPISLVLCQDRSAWVSCAVHAQPFRIGIDHGDAHRSGDAAVFDWMVP